MISFIVSVMDRPNFLTCCLASLRCQIPVQHEIIVTDNGGPDYQPIHKMICHQFNAIHMNTYSLGAHKDEYLAAELAVPKATGKWLCFPNDDDYYVPFFAKIMENTGDDNQWDLVYCDAVMDPRMFGIYQVLRTEPKMGSIDKGSFIVRREIFNGFPTRTSPETIVTADGRFIEAIVKTGIRHGKAPGVMFVHN